MHRIPQHSQRGRVKRARKKKKKRNTHANLNQIENTKRGEGLRKEKKRGFQKGKGGGRRYFTGRGGKIGVVEEKYTTIRKKKNGAKKVDNMWRSDFLGKETWV